MPLSEINELISQLLTLFWSAAAGNIQLGSTCLKTGSTATLTDDLSNIDMMQMSAGDLNSATNTDASGQTVKSSASVDMIVVHDMDTLLVLDSAGDEFPPKTNLLESATASLSQASSTSRKEVKFFLPDHGRLSTGSNMSTGSVESSNTASTVNQFSPQHGGSGPGSGSSRSADGDMLVLQPGCCIRQKKEIKVKDVKIAAKAIEIISCFVQYRKGRLTLIH